MNIACKAQGFEISSAIEFYVREEIQRTLGRFSDDIIAIDMFMRDTNGPKGGVDKQILMRVKVRGRQQITIQTTREDLYAAISICVKRAKRAIRRSLRKARRFEKLALRRLAAETVGQEATNA